jgi:protein with PEP-CTERM/exosortase system signal
LVAEEQWDRARKFGLGEPARFFSPVHGIPPTVGVFSDFSLDSQIPVNADGVPVQVGTDGNVPVIATYTDLAADSEVPDIETTASLFGLSLAGLAFLRRKLC